MIWLLYALAAFAGIAMFSLGWAAVWRHCEVPDPAEKRAACLRAYSNVED